MKQFDDADEKIEVVTKVEVDAIYHAKLVKYKKNTIRYAGCTYKG